MARQGFLRITMFGLLLVVVGLVTPTIALAGYQPPLVAPGTAGTMLNDRFGVVPALQSSAIAPGTGLPYDWNSLVPTLNTSTVDFAINDWYGNWSATAFNATPLPRTVRHVPGFDWWPSGDEWYDTEALYFDNDATNFYLALISSSPFSDTVNIGGVPTNIQGTFDTRLSPGIVIPPSDIAIDLGLDTARTELLRRYMALQLRSRPGA